MPEKRPQLTDNNSISGLIGLGNIPGSAPVIGFNPQLTESLLRTKGIRALHYKHAINPDRETIAGGVNVDTNAAKYGWRYYSVRELLAIPQQNSLQESLTVNGAFTMASILLNITGHYVDGCQEHVFCRPHDLIVFDKANITTEVNQLIEYNPNGPLKLNFRCEAVDYIADNKKEYKENIDFIVCDGKIAWIPSGKKPEFKNGKGAILTIVYYIKPIYIVEHLPHSIRITPGNLQGSGAVPRDAYYAPQQVVCKESWTRNDNEELLDFSSLPVYNYPDSPNDTSGK